MQSNHSIATLKSILSEWFAAIDQVPIEMVTATTGISGSQVWKVSHDEEEYCLKKWPQPNYSPANHAAKHRLLLHVRENGFSFAPVASSDRRGHTVVERGNYLWDLTTWMKGAPYERRSLKGEALEKAMVMLAQFHIAAQSFTESNDSVSAKASVAMKQRHSFSQSLSSETLDLIELQIYSRPVDNFTEVLLRILSALKRTNPTVLSRLEHGANRPLPQQFCIRDAKYDHFLFQNGEASGVIDFGAAAVDSVACDIARLVGSLEDITPVDWQVSIDAYLSVRPLSLEELEAIPLFDLGGIVSAAANWLRWLGVERRQFENRRAVRSQLDWLANRLQGVS